MTFAERAAVGGYTVATREKLRALWLNFAWAGPSEKIDAERSFDALWAEQSSTLAVKKVAEMLDPWAFRPEREIEERRSTLEALAGEERRSDAMSKASAIVVEFGPLVSTRERIERLIALDASVHPIAVRQITDRLIASGAVVEPSAPTGDLRERLTWMADNRPDDDYAATLREAAAALASIEADRG